MKSTRHVTAAYSLALTFIALISITIASHRLESGKKYKICAVANSLCMTAEEGEYGEHLGIVRLEQFQNLKAQRWRYTLSHRQASVFASEENRYNNVTTYHENISFHIFNEFKATEIEGAELAAVSYSLRKSGYGAHKENPLCVEQQGVGKAVQLLPCTNMNVDQQWAFELLP